MSKLLAFAGVVAAGALVGTCAVAQNDAPMTPPSPTPVQQEAPAPQTYESHVEVFGDGKATLTVMTGGMSSNEVTLPETQQLPEGHATVSVTRSPSVESYMNGGQGDSGDVGCRIVRDGQVVEEQTAQGQFASVSCSKFY